MSSVDGTIPALAGSTARPAATPVQTPDHPRAGGEHPEDGRPHLTVDGPSPRWRGAQLTACLFRRVLGPSPRWRGAPRLGPFPPRPGGTIPALAGSTPATATPSPPARDHPRAGGEHPCYCHPLPSRAGPSPRWRGAPLLLPPPPLPRGTIPALAGSTTAGSISPSTGRDHPRAGGEHGRGGRRAIFAKGPSPRWRGARARRAAGDLRQGTIPALAGSTPLRSLGWASCPDHPRAGGEHRCAATSCMWPRGPSPRWRGAQRGRVRAPEVGGTIPALAGSTRDPRQARV